MLSPQQQPLPILLYRWTVLANIDKTILVLQSVNRLHTQRNVQLPLGSAAMTGSAVRKHSVGTPEGLI